MTNKKNHRRLVLILLASLSGVVAMTGCDEPCNTTSEAVNQLKYTRADLAVAISHSTDRQAIVDTCDGLVQAADALREKADFVRTQIATKHYAVPNGSCVQWTPRLVCTSGGWSRSPYGGYVLSSVMEPSADRVLATEETPAEESEDGTYEAHGGGGGHSGGGHSGGGHSGGGGYRGGGGHSGGGGYHGGGGHSGGGSYRPPSHGGGGYHPPSHGGGGYRPTPTRGGGGYYRPVPGRHVPLPHPRPRPAYPVGRGPHAYRPHAPSYGYPERWPHYWNRGWDWWYSAPVCFTRNVCTAYAPGSITLPGYDDAMALAYELDQIAGNMETACRTALETDDLADAVSRLQAAYDEINQHTLPEALNLYNGLGCTNSGS